MSARWALIRTVRRGHPADGAAPTADTPPIFWGRVGPYEGVTRHGTLYLLAPDQVHPALRVTSGA